MDVHTCLVQIRDYEDEVVAVRERGNRQTPSVLRALRCVGEPFEAEWPSEDETRRAPLGNTSAPPSGMKMATPGCAPVQPGAVYRSNAKTPVADVPGTPTPRRDLL
jgi:hypothetical protein